MTKDEHNLLLLLARIVLAGHNSSGPGASKQRSSLRGAIAKVEEPEPFRNENHASTCALYWDPLLQGINSACGCGGLAKDRASQVSRPEQPT